MSSVLYVTLSAFVVLALSANGLTIPKEAPAASDSPMTPNQIMSMLNVTKGSPQEAVLNRLKAMNDTELHTLMNQTMIRIGGNFTLLREGKQWDAFLPFLLPLFFGGFGGGSIFSPAPAPAPSFGGGDDFATLTAVTILGLALISRFPTQG
ncbi:hypothetical protein RvY_07277 [Ramazzottius varieornatus]|uniref:Uncharacterized protein n=1 Tax=Ramazzottius varieornatus TaxID=947166 RepID=A0A1D1V1J2_RAMVA|nr:hypothetical protein RvY_07277 [Ramazzottius varieornatus]